METGMGRRVFVGSVVAGVPLLAASAVRAFGQSATWAVHTHEAAVVDPVLEHIARQLAVLHNGMRRDPRGEHLRGFAAQLRTMSVYGRQAGIDERLRSALRTLIDRDGRDAVLYAKQDRNHLLDELRRYGAQPDERLIGADSDLDYGRRSTTLDALLDGGVSARLQQVALLLERAAPEFDRRLDSLVRVSQYDPAYWQGYCAELWEQYRETQFLAAALCASAALPIVGALFAPECIAWQLAATLLAMVYAARCWNV